jgi:hypothetical protein
MDNLCMQTHLQKWVVLEWADFLGLGNTPDVFQKLPYLLPIALSVLYLFIGAFGLDGRLLNELQSEMVLLQTGIACRV